MLSRTEVSASKNSFSNKLLVGIKERDHPRHEQGVPIAAEGVGLQGIGKTFNRVLNRLQPLAQVIGPGWRDDIVDCAVMDADGGVGAIQVVDGRNGQ